jgi:hypothetical protein
MEVEERLDFIDVAAKRMTVPYCGMLGHCKYTTGLSRKQEFLKEFALPHFRPLKAKPLHSNAGAWKSASEDRRIKTPKRAYAASS